MILETTDKSASPHAQKTHVTDPVVRHAEIHGRQGGDLRQPTRLHQGQVIADHSSIFLHCRVYINGQGRAIDVMYLDFAKAFDTVPTTFLTLN